MVWLEKTPGSRRYPIRNLRDEKEPVMTNVEEGNSREGAEASKDGSWKARVARAERGREIQA